MRGPWPACSSNGAYADGAPPWDVMLSRNMLLRSCAADSCFGIFQGRARPRLTLTPDCPPQVAQAGLLAQRDSLSPFRVVLATSAVSLAGDLLFIGALGWGVAGAAWTTVAAQARL